MLTSPTATLMNSRIPDTQRKKKKREKKDCFNSTCDKKWIKSLKKIYGKCIYIINTAYFSWNFNYCMETYTTFTWKQPEKPHPGKRILPYLKKAFFFSPTLNFNDERFSFITQAKTFGTTWLQSIMIRHCLPSCLLKHQEIGLDYLKIYFAFSIALS